ncbi:hypothetical protein BJ742DRAFT_794931 [Cladochytrium replicatum]|nr:hypothetical protein BJ742DRAFT_794931 [Cladochytrium replicatum]
MNPQDHHQSLAQAGAPPFMPGPPPRAGPPAGPPPTGPGYYNAPPPMMIGEQPVYNYPPPVTQPVTTYMRPPSNLQGWNDAPTHVFHKKAAGAIAAVATTQELDAISNGVIIERLSSAMEAVSASILEPQQRKVVEDTSKRVEYLFERLGGEQVPAASAVILKRLVIALNDRDFAGATNQAVQLTTTSTGDDVRWSIGVKRMVDLYARIA